jgi:hypothetical protein
VGGLAGSAEAQLLARSSPRGSRLNQSIHAGEAFSDPASSTSSACAIRCRAARVFPQRVSHSASTASSQARNSALGAAPGVGASGDHALGCSLAVTREAGDERGVGEDGGAEETASLLLALEPASRPADATDRLWIVDGTLIRSATGRSVCLRPQLPLLGECEGHHRCRHQAGRGRRPACAGRPGRRPGLVL